MAYGVDPAFDKILSSLGYIARHKPRPVIDSVMFWRKSKSEAATSAANAAASAMASAGTSSTPTRPPNSHHVSSASTSRGHSSISLNGFSLRQKSNRSLSDRSPLNYTSKGNSNQSSGNIMRTPLHRYNSSKSQNRQNNTFHQQSYSYSDLAITAARETALQADRKSLISIYVLCRVLIEVVKQTSTKVLGEEMGDKLEEIVFRQIKTADFSLVSSSSTRAANWNLFAELLGQMSKIRFVTVGDRFIAELEKQLSNATTLTKDQETNIQLLIYGMRYLKLRVRCNLLICFCSRLQSFHCFCYHAHCHPCPNP